MDPYQTMATPAAGQPARGRAEQREIFDGVRSVMRISGYWVSHAVPGWSGSNSIQRASAR